MDFPHVIHIVKSNGTIIRYMDSPPYERRKPARTSIENEQLLINSCQSAPDSQFCKDTFYKEKHMH